METAVFVNQLLCCMGMCENGDGGGGEGRRRRVKERERERVNGRVRQSTCNRQYV